MMYCQTISRKYATTKPTTTLAYTLCHKQVRRHASHLLASRNTSMGKFVVFDCESVLPKRMVARRSTHAIQVAALLVNEHGHVSKQYSKSTRPAVYTVPTSYEQEILSKLPGIYQVMADLRLFIGSHVIVAHNKSYDRNFLKHYIEKDGMPFENDWLCTMQLSKRLVKDAPNHRLSTLCQYLNIPLAPNHPFHTAEGDAIATNALFIALQRKLLMYPHLSCTLPLLSAIQSTPIPMVEQMLQNMDQHHRSLALPNIKKSL